MTKATCCRSKFWPFTHTTLEFLTQKGIFAGCHIFIDAPPRRIPQIYADFPSLVRSRGLARHINKVHIT